MGGLREFSKVMQTFDCVPGFHNYLEFSESPRVKKQKRALLLEYKTFTYQAKISGAYFSKEKVYNSSGYNAN